MSRNQTGIVLEGGSMRGMFTAGVLDVLMESGITFPAAIGVSAGACFGCNLKSHQIGRVIRYNVRLCRDKRYSGLRCFLRTGDVYGAAFCYDEIPNRLDPFDTETYQADPMAFYVVCTRVSDAQAVIRRIDRGDAEDLRWMRASASMPLASRPVQIGNEDYLDGGVADPIPLQAFEQLGWTRNVVVLTQPRGYVKKPARLMPAFRLFLRRMPAMVEAMETRHTRYNLATAYVARAEARGRALVIRPDRPLEVGAVEHDPEKLKAVYAHGREVALRELARVKAFVETEDAETQRSV